MKGKTLVFKAKDHLVSKKEFSIYWDEERGLAQTDVSSNLPLESYYNSKEYDSHKIYHKTLIDRVYRVFQHIMLFRKWKLIRLYYSSGIILDIGAGTGTFAKFMKKKGFQIEVVEPYNEAVKHTIKNITHYKSISNVPKERKYSLITLWHVLEHLPNLNSVFKSLNTLLETSGKLIIAVPNWESNDARHYASDWAALDVPRHLWHFTPHGLKKLAKIHGFECISQKPLWLDAFYISYLSERAKGTNLSILIGFIKGVYFTLKSVYNKKFSSLIFVFKKSF